MASGYYSGLHGKDLDDLFAMRVNTPRDPVGYVTADGLDLSQRYEQIGTYSAIGATGFKCNSTDLASLFRGAGSGEVFTLVAGASSPYTGFRSGFFGSLTPSTLKTRTVTDIYSWLSGGNSYFVVTISSPVALAQNFFNAVQPNGEGGAYFASASASFSTAAPKYTWTWGPSTGFLFVNGNSYQTIFT